MNEKNVIYFGDILKQSSLTRQTCARCDIFVLYSGEYARGKNNKEKKIAFYNGVASLHA